jgi:predicted acyl esterase
MANLLLVMGVTMADRRIQPHGAVPHSRAQRRNVGRWRRSALVSTAVLVAGLLAACAPPPKQAINQNVPPDPVAVVRASIGGISVTGMPPGTEVALSGPVERTARADDLGAVLFRDLPAADGYAVRAPDLERTGLTVPTIESSTPSPSFYAAQRLTSGYQYLTMRDGTSLAATVYLPPGSGPFPTVVQYSGYSEAAPGRNYTKPLADLGIPLEVVCPVAPYVCTSPAGKGLLAAMFGYAVVNVNVRGTGCSGGAFELLTDQFRADGYDIIETVAAQPWVLGRRVGMVGASFHGFSQIAVASTRPPSLAAIAPEVPLKDAVRDVAGPGGIVNAGFAEQWTQAVENGADPYGQGWERALVDAGDVVCERNQVLHGQRQRLLPRFDVERYYPSDLAYTDRTAAAAAVDVPVLLTAQWQDEQVGPAAADLCDGFTAAPVRKCVFSNGFHGDQNPDMVVEWKAFLDFYVRRQRVPIGPIERIAFAVAMESSFGAAVDLPAEPFLGFLGLVPSTDELRRQYEAAPGVKLLLDVGAAGPARSTVPRAVANFTQWPPAGMSTERYELAADGSLRPPTEGGSPDSAVSFRASNARASQQVGRLAAPPGSTSSIPMLDWQQDPPGGAAVFLTDPFADDRLVVGPGRADLWIRSSEAGADLGVTVSEVAPDGTERFIQAGLARAELAVPGPNATDLDPAVTGDAASARPVEPGRWQRASVRVLPFAHLVRAGSRLRVSIHSPGGDHLEWAFKLDPVLQAAEPTIDIGTGGNLGSTIAFGSVPAPVSTPLPACGVLRAQACRTFQPYVNTGSTP